MNFGAMFGKVLMSNGLITAFVIIAITNLIAYKLAGLSKGRIHGSAVAILFGLVLAYIGGGSKGIATIPLFAGIGMMGGAMFRDFAIVSTAGRVTKSPSGFTRDSLRSRISSVMFA